MKSSKKYERSRVILLQDVLISLLASLLAILFARWILGVFYGFSWVVAKYLAVALIATLVGILWIGSHKAVREFATVRSMAKTLLAVGIKDLVLALAFLVGLIRVPSAAYAALAILADFIFTCGGLFGIRAYFRMLSHSDAEIKTLATYRTALVSGTDEAALQLANSLEKENYSVLGLLTNDRNLSGRVIADRVVYYCVDQHEMEQLIWRLGGIDGIFFPHGEVVPLMGGGC